MPSLEEMHHRLRNYSRLKDSLHAVMAASLRCTPVHIGLEARYSTSVCYCVDTQYIGICANLNAMTTCVLTIAIPILIG